MFLWNAKSHKNIHTGADEGTRTPTSLTLVPKTSASTSSATSACSIDNVYLSTFQLLLSIEILYIFLILTIKNILYPKIPLFFTGGCSFIVLASSTNSSLCSFDSRFGVWISTVNIKSPS